MFQSQLTILASEFFEDFCELNALLEDFFLNVNDKITRSSFVVDGRFLMRFYFPSFIVVLFSRLLIVEILSCDGSFSIFLLFTFSFFFFL